MRIQRRSFLGGIAASPLLLSGTATAEEGTPAIEKEYFAALDGLRDVEKKDAIVGCANALCRDIDLSNTPVNEMVELRTDLTDSLRRVRFAVRILDEQNITNAIDESAVQSVATTGSTVTVELVDDSLRPSLAAPPTS
jgi:hypothetical protein